MPSEINRLAISGIVRCVHNRERVFKVGRFVAGKDPVITANRRAIETVSSDASLRHSNSATGEWL